MPDLFVITRVMWMAVLAAEVIVIVRIVYEGLLRSYPFLASYLTVEVFFGMLLIQIDLKSPLYAQAYIAYTAVLVVFKVGVGWELLNRIYDHYPGIGKVAGFLTAALLLYGALVAAMHKPTEAAIWEGQGLGELLAAVRYQGEIFALAFVGVYFFFRSVIVTDAPWRRNVSLHAKTATTYFAISGSASFIALFMDRPRSISLVNAGLLVFDFGCLLSWMRLNAAGEGFPARFKLTPPEIAAAVAHEEELFATLSGLRMPMRQPKGNQGGRRQRGH